MRRRARSNDLFEIFPDLPRMRHRTPDEQLVDVWRHVHATRIRANQNIARQRDATAHVRAAISARRRR